MVLGRLLVPLIRALLTLALMGHFQPVTASVHISLYDLAGMTEPSLGWPILEDSWSLVPMVRCPVLPRPAIVPGATSLKDV